MYNWKLSHAPRPSATCPACGYVACDDVGFGDCALNTFGRIHQHLIECVATYPDNFAVLLTTFSGSRQPWFKPARTGDSITVPEAGFKRIALGATVMDSLRASGLHSSHSSNGGGLRNIVEAFLIEHLQVTGGTVE